MDQMVVYRKDGFSRGTGTNKLFERCYSFGKLHNPPEMYGFVAATKVDENFMSQVLEHVFWLMEQHQSMQMVFRL